MGWLVVCGVEDIILQTKVQVMCSGRITDEVLLEGLCINRKLKFQSNKTPRIESGEVRVMSSLAEVIEVAKPDASPQVRCSRLGRGCYELCVLAE